MPEDISVIGYDDIPMATLPFIDLTTVGQDATATAQQAFEDVSGRLDANASAGTQGLVSPYLAVRSTTRRATVDRLSNTAGQRLDRLTSGPRSHARCMAIACERAFPLVRTPRAR